MGWLLHAIDHYNYSTLERDMMMLHNSIFVMIDWNCMNIPKYTLMGVISFKSKMEKDNILYMNIALRRFLHNHGNIATEGSPKPGLCPTLISNDLNGSL